MQIQNLISLSWYEKLAHLMDWGEPVSPRGQATSELMQSTIRVDMNYPALICPPRKISYRFMAAEAYWILTGDDSVKGIAPYNKQIAQFSDDGRTFFGAYGPKIVAQLPYVVRKLQQDPETRQAWLSIWRESPPETKDVPCTLMLGWTIRNNRLHCHAFMRSSDIWLGVPYDVFNFSMVSAYVRQLLQRPSRSSGDKFEGLELGDLHLTAASSHLYHRNWSEAQDISFHDLGICQPVPKDFSHVLNGLLHARGSQTAFEIADAQNPFVWEFWRSY